MRVSRSRSRNSGIPSPGYSYWWVYKNGAWVLNTTGTYVNTPMWTEEISDFVGLPYSDSNLSIRKCLVIPSTISGTTTVRYGVSKQDALNMPAPVPAAGSINYDPPVPNWEDVASRALKSANPNSPEIDIIVFAAELRELPSLFRQGMDLIRKFDPKESTEYKKYLETWVAAKRNGQPSIDKWYVRWKASKGPVGEMMRDLSGSNLAYQFGWAPFVGDLLDLFGVAESFDKRIRYLKKMEKGIKLHRQLGTKVRKRTMFSNQTVGLAQATFSSGAPVADVTETTWFTMEMKLLESFAELPFDKQVLKAAQAVLGLELNAEAVWNLVPWSWLLDWCSNIGDVLSQTRNQLDFEWKNLNMMHLTSYETEYLGKPSSQYWNTKSITSGKVRYERKLRQVRPNPYALPSLTLPAFTGRQLGILASLWTVRRGASSASWLRTE